MSNLKAFAVNELDMTEKTIPSIENMWEKEKFLNRVESELAVIRA